LQKNGKQPSNIASNLQSELLNVNFTWAIDNFSIRLANDGDKVHSPPFAIDQQGWRVLIWRNDKYVYRKRSNSNEVTELLSIRLVPNQQTEQNLSIQASWEISYAKNALGRFHAKLFSSKIQILKKTNFLLNFIIIV
jgi:hypothetical protein